LILFKYLATPFPREKFGKLGLTSIGDSPEEAQEIYDKVVRILDKNSSGQIDELSWFPDNNFPIEML
jgi:hypothetical protein